MKMGFQAQIRKGRLIHLQYPLPPELGKLSDTYLECLENILCQMLSPSFVSALKKTSHCHLLPGHFEHLDEELPLITWSNSEQAPCSIMINLLCHTDLTHGLGRYFTDLACRWLVPGKFLSIWCNHALNFKFSSFPRKSYFFNKIAAHIETSEDLHIIQENLPRIAKELRLNLLSVKLARGITATKRLSQEEKKALVEENLVSLLGRTRNGMDTSSYEHLHHFWLKLDSEPLDYRAKFNHFLKKAKPKIYDRDIYYEIEQLSHGLNSDFKALRSLHHLKRLVSYQFLFTKILRQAERDEPGKRHLSLKILRTKLQLPDGEKKVFGILGAMNRLHQRELFGKQHLLKALQLNIPNASPIEDSYYGMEQDDIRFFYLEIEKPSDFAPSEMTALKNSLPKNIRKSIENLIPQVFIPPDPEDIARSFSLLQCEFQRRPNTPLAMITFHRQTDEKLLFNVVLTRNCEMTCTPLPDILSKTGICFENFQMSPNTAQNVEISFFNAVLEKTPFLRTDFSIDLLKARQALSKKLTDALGALRDYNGGNFALQCELLEKVSVNLGELAAKNELLLEDFFYNFTPSNPKNHPRSDRVTVLFRLLLQSIETKNSLLVEPLDTAFLGVCSLPNPKIKQTLQEMIFSFQTEWAYFTHVRDDETTYFCFILDPFDQQDRLISSLKEVLK